jgi:predicted phage terminase large subunit-like protein
MIESLSIDEIEKEIARKSHLEFLRYTWPYTTINFLTGHHINKTCTRIDEAIEDFRNGESTFLKIKMPYRHHKSQTVTRSLPSRFLGLFPEAEIIVASYGQDLSNGFSRDARSLTDGDEFKELFPDTKISPSSSGVGSWMVETDKGGKVLTGKTHWVGLGGSINGKGGSLIIVDDFLKGRQDAESKKIREKIWSSFTNDIMSRRAEPCIVIVLATPWHTDDIFGRIDDKMSKDPNFPCFEQIVFPHKSKSYKTGYLFPEKFSPKWYESQESTLGPYGASGLLYCDPKAREGALIKCVEGVNWHYVDEKPEGFSADGRAWDLASSEEETLSDDPDWTVGVKGSIKIDTKELMNEYGKIISAPVYSVYIDDIIRMREEAPARNSAIQTTAVNDSRTGTIQGIEAFAGYKDTYTTIAHTLSGICEVEKINLKGDKVTKAAQHIVTPFSDGNVYVNRNIDADTLREFFEILQSFPSGSHDDDVDALTCMVAMMKEYGYSTFDTMV